MVATHVTHYIYIYLNNISYTYIYMWDGPTKEKFIYIYMNI